MKDPSKFGRSLNLKWVAYEIYICGVHATVYFNEETSQPGVEVLKRRHNIQRFYTVMKLRNILILS